MFVDGLLLTDSFCPLCSLLCIVNNRKLYFLNNTLCNNIAQQWTRGSDKSCGSAGGPIPAAPTPTHTLYHSVTSRHSPVSKGWMSGPSSYEAVDILDSSPDSSFAETTGSKLNTCNRWYVKRVGQRTTQDVADQYAVRVASARARVCDVTARRPSADRELAAGAKVGSRMLEDTSSDFV